MKKQASIWVVIGFLVLTLGIVYALSTSKPATETVNTATESPIRNQATSMASASEQSASLSPDLSKTNPYQFLDPAAVGKQAPDFSAKTADGKPIRLQDFRNRKNLVLIFYQGSFCSVCGAQLSNLQKHLADFQAQDAEIIAISADDQVHALTTLGEHGLSFPVVPDADKSIIEKYGVSNISKHGIAWPSAFIVDKQGVVRLSFASPEGHRLHSNELLPELSRITGKPAPKLAYDE